MIDESAHLELAVTKIRTEEELYLVQKFCFSQGCFWRDSITELVTWNEYIWDEFVCGFIYLNLNTVSCDKFLTIATSREKEVRLVDMKEFFALVSE